MNPLFFVIARSAPRDDAIQPILGECGTTGWPRSLRLLAMTTISFLFLFSAASATKLAVCDGKSYDVTIVNGGQSHVAHLSPAGGAIEEFGPQVSMQIEGQPAVKVTEQYDEYCIWSGKIKLQQVRSGNDSLSGGDAR